MGTQIRHWLRSAGGTPQHQDHQACEGFLLVYELAQQCKLSQALRKQGNSRAGIADTSRHTQMPPVLPKSKDFAD